MKTYDAAQLTEQLGAMAATFDRKPLTAEALKVWFDTLKEFPTHQVLGVLSTWTKHHGKMPAPSEVWKVVNEIGIGEREKEAAQAKVDARKPIDYPVTENGKRAMAEIRQIVVQPKRSPREHWHSVLSTCKPHSIGYRYATEALAVLDRKRRPIEPTKAMREPGEDEAAA